MGTVDYGAMRIQFEVMKEVDVEVGEQSVTHRLSASRPPAVRQLEMTSCVTAGRRDSSL